MAESIIFQCDMCGQKSEEEPAALPRRERCRVEFVFRGQRFVLQPPPPVDVPAMPVPWAALPFPPGAVIGPAPWPPLWPADPVASPSVDPAAVAAPPPEEDDRVVYTLCDGCMKRTCAFFDLKVEAFEEYSARIAREADLARRVSSPLPTGGGMKGEMVEQFPTRARQPGHGPGPGGLVDQFPTPGASKSSEASAAAGEDNKPEEPPPPVAEA